MLVCLAIPAMAAQSPETPYGVLTIRLVSLDGRSLPSGKLSVYSSDNTLTYSAWARNEAKVRLPYGDYAVKFESEFLKPATRAVKINRPDCFMVLGTDMASVVLDMILDPVAVSVRVRDPESCTPAAELWAKLVSVYCDYVAERPIGPNGFALFDPVDTGKYLLIIVDGEHIRATKGVDTSGKITVVDVKLDACPESVPRH